MGQGRGTLIVIATSVTIETLGRNKLAKSMTTHATLVKCTLGAVPYHIRRYCNNRRYCSNSRLCLTLDIRRYITILYVVICLTYLLGNYLHQNLVLMCNIRDSQLYQVFHQCLDMGNDL